MSFVVAAELDGPVYLANQLNLQLVARTDGSGHETISGASFSTDMKDAIRFPTAQSAAQGAVLANMNMQFSVKFVADTAEVAK